MNATKKFTEPNKFPRITVSTDVLQQMLGCGRASAVNIGDQAGARMQIGRRVLWNVEKVKAYIDDLSE